MRVLSWSQVTKRSETGGTPAASLRGTRARFDQALMRRGRLPAVEEQEAP